MPNLEFNEENFEPNNHFKSRVIFGHSKTPTMVKGLIKLGIVKDEKHAGYLLIGLAGLFFILSVYVYVVYIFGFQIVSSKTPPQRERRFINGRVVSPGLIQNANNQK